MTYRLLTWNILEGLLQRESEDGYPHQDERRVRAAQDLVREIDPDILVLNEALYAQEFDGMQQRYADLFGFPYFLTQLYEGAWGNAILSRYPIIQQVCTYIYPAGSHQNRGAIAAKVAFPDGHAWVATLHPHPQRRAFKRGADFDEFLERLRGPVILAGDLNAISPEDQIDHERLIAAFEKFSRPGDAVPSIQRFLNAGRILFEDVLPRFRMYDAVPPERRAPTIPTKLLSGNGDSSIRIDHIVVTPEVGVVDARVLRDERADVASDHYPILFEFRLPHIAPV